MIVMARIPDSVKITLTHRLENHRAARWPPLARLNVHSFLLSGLPTGTPEEALDCSCGLYLGDLIAWIQPPKD